jgi:electron transfer flavoprotein beta subunit
LTLSAEGDTVIVVAIGDAPAEEALREARAMGAGRAILVTDESLKNADAFVLTRALHCLVKQVGDVKLILLGADVLDADLTQIGPRLAEDLNCPIIENAHQVSSDGLTAQAIVQRWGAFYRGEVDLPAVISVAHDSNKPRYAQGANLLNVYRAKDAVEVLTAADLQMAEADLTPLLKLRGESFPPERELGKRLEGDIDEMARQLAEVIHKRI